MRQYCAYATHDDIRGITESSTDRATGHMQVRSVGDGWWGSAVHYEDIGRQGMWSIIT